jgi:hypothetical protein
MPLTIREIRTGSIAYFDDKLLLAETDVKHRDVHLDRPGPFVCVQVQGDKSVWSPVTTSSNQPDRLKFDARWKRDGSPAWRNNDQYLNDGFNTFIGPNAAFLRAAAGEQPFSPNRRPWLNADGQAAVLVEIAKRGGELLPDATADA